MSKFTHACGAAGQRGVTVIELMVAVSLATVLASMVFMAWNSINIHVIAANRKATFHADAQGIVRSIVTQVRRSSEVLGWHGYGITFIDAAGDTVNYEYNGYELMRNGEPVAIAAQDAAIKEFAIEVEEEGLGPAGPTGLLAVKLKMADEFGNETMVRTNVAVPWPAGVEAGETSSPWNF